MRGPETRFASPQKFSHSPSGGQVALYVRLSYSFNWHSSCSPKKTWNYHFICSVHVKDLRHSRKFCFVNGWCEGARQTFGVQAFKEGVFNQLLKQNSIVEVLGTPLSSRFFRSTNFLIRDLWRSPSASPSHWMGTHLTQESRLPNLHYLGGGWGRDRKYFTTYLRDSPVCGPHLRKLFVPKSLLLWGSQYQDKTFSVSARNTSAELRRAFP